MVLLVLELLMISVSRMLNKSYKKASIRFRLVKYDLAGRGTADSVYHIDEFFLMSSKIISQNLQP